MQATDHSWIPFLPVGPTSYGEVEGCKFTTFEEAKLKAYELGHDEVGGCYRYIENGREIFELFRRDSKGDRGKVSHKFLGKEDCQQTTWNGYKEDKFYQAFKKLQEKHDSMKSELNVTKDELSREKKTNSSLKATLHNEKVKSSSLKDKLDNERKDNNKLKKRIRIYKRDQEGIRLLVEQYKSISKLRNGKKLHV